MPLSVEELLKPRIKRINKWPGMPHNCPELLKISGDRFYFLFDLDMELGYPLSSLPEWSHMVKPLEWWEDRKIEEMPEYYKYSGNHGIFKTSFRPSGGIVMLNFSPTETAPVKLEYCLPATHEEYLSYINSTTKQD